MCTTAAQLKKVIKSVLVTIFFIILRLWVFCLYIYLEHVHVWYPWKSEEGVGPPRTRDAVSCELLPCGRW